VNGALILQACVCTRDGRLSIQFNVLPIYRVHELQQVPQSAWQFNGAYRPGAHASEAALQATASLPFRPLPVVVLIDVARRPPSTW